MRHRQVNVLLLISSHFGFCFTFRFVLFYSSYVNDLNEIFFWRNISNPVAFTYMIGMAIYCQYTVIGWFYFSYFASDFIWIRMHFQMNFAAGYGLAIVQWVQLYYVCDLGRNIQVQFCSKFCWKQQLQSTLTIERTSFIFQG